MSNKYAVVERFADNGSHSHFELFNIETGAIVQEEIEIIAPEEIEVFSHSLSYRYQNQLDYIPENNIKLEMPEVAPAKVETSKPKYTITVTEVDRSEPVPFREQLSDTELGQAKKDAIKIWEWLSENPGVRNKKNLPTELYKLALLYKNNCPLCEFYYKNTTCSRDCPIIKKTGLSCYDSDSLFDKWVSRDMSHNYALYILEITKTWEC